MTFTQTFGGTTIYPSDVSYLAITLDADRALEWPLENSTTEDPAARIIDVTTTGSHSISLPNATQTGAGQTILFNNLSASTSSFTLKDYAGSTIATVAVGEQWQVYLAGTSTAAGTWRVFRYGASTATVQASALAGYGLTVTSNTLSQSTPVTTFNSSPRTVLATDRASMVVWEGTGAGTLNLLSTVAAGNNYVVSVRNSGGGDLTVDAAGSETIDGTATLVLRPGDSTSLTTDGLTWFTLGLGQQAVFAFDYTSITVTGGNYTLAGSELNRIAYEFVGALTSDAYIIVPPTIQQYWISNATTGAYALYLRTASGTPIAVTQGARGIYYCNGSNVVDADTSTVALPVTVPNGGTGITNYGIGDLLYANSASTLAKLSDVAVGNALISGGVGVAPSWGKVDLTTHITGQLPVANGGTGAASLTSGYLVKGNGTSAVSASVAYDDGTNVGIGTSSPGAKLDVTGNIRLSNTSPNIELNNGGPMVYSAVSNTLMFATGGGPSSPVERMRIDSSGSVGIGTTSPATTLDVQVNSPSATAQVRAYNADSTASALAGMIVGTAHGEYAQWYAYNGASWFGTTSNHPQIILTNNTERMRITSSGDVGIGTTSPGYRLDVASADTTAGIGYAMRLRQNATAGGVAIQFTDSTVSTETGAIINNSSEMSIRSASSRNFNIWTNSSERMRIDSSGNVGIGITTPSGPLDVRASAGPTAIINSYNNTSSGAVASVFSNLLNNANSTSSYHYAGVTQGVNIWYLYGNGTSSWSSDQRLKKNIETTRNGYLEDICQLRVVKYNWHTDADGKPRELGLIAQEVEAVFPGLVEDALHTIDETGVKYKVLKGSVLPFMLLKALQEANDKIDELAARVAQLEGQ